MSYCPEVSLVIVSRNRPTGLRRLISALRFQTYSTFEVVVVSNYRSLDFLRELPNAANIRSVYFDRANISAARNIGICNAAGEIIAFCDDDAVPEPFWLERLVAPFVESKVGCAGGFVRGRNGIDYQWTALKCNRFGDDFPLEMADNNVARVVDFDGEFFAKVQGTNCAFRKSAMVQAGGFDEGFRFYLDETDLTISLAQKGWATAIVPLAEVQHGFEASEERTGSRAPKSLKNIGASKRRFLEKHAGADNKASVQLLRSQQRQRLIRLMVGGYLEPRDVPRLMKSLEDGLSGPGTDTKRQQTTPEPKNNPEFRAFWSGGSVNTFTFAAISGHAMFAKKLSAKALELLKNSVCTTVFRYTLTALYHRRYFDVRGFWVQTGGLYGKSDRTSNTFKFHTLNSRTMREASRLKDQHPVAVLYMNRIYRDTVLELPKSDETHNM